MPRKKKHNFISFFPGANLECQLLYSLTKKCPSIVQCPMYAHEYVQFFHGIKPVNFKGPFSLSYFHLKKSFTQKVKKIYFSVWKSKFFFCFCSPVILSHWSKSDNHKSLVPSNTPILVIKRLYCTVFVENTEMIECHYFRSVYLNSHHAKGLPQKVLQKVQVWILWPLNKHFFSQTHQHVSCFILGHLAFWRNPWGNITKRIV